MLNFTASHVSMMISLFFSDLHMSFRLIKFLFSPVHGLRKKKSHIFIEVILAPYISHKAINGKILSLNNVMCLLSPKTPPWCGKRLARFFSYRRRSNRKYYRMKGLFCFLYIYRKKKSPSIYMKWPFSKYHEAAIKCFQVLHI